MVYIFKTIFLLSIERAGEMKTRFVLIENHQSIGFQVYIQKKMAFDAENVGSAH